MLKIENTEVSGWESAIREIDGGGCEYQSGYIFYKKMHEFRINSKVLEIMKNLNKSGNDEFLEKIFVTSDITAPIYWWNEFETYKVGTVANSCSTMHKIHEKEFTLGDFSYEHLFGSDYRIDRDTGNLINNNDDTCELRINFGYEDEYETWSMCGVLETIIDALNVARNRYLETKDKKYLWQMIQLLPSSYNQKRTVQLNYQVLKQMYFARRNHKLDEWHTLCDWMLTLPYFKELCVDAVAREGAKNA